MGMEQAQRANEVIGDALVCRFRVPGIARTKGSPQVVAKGKGGRPLPFPRVIHDTPQLREWEKAVAGAARVAMRNREPLAGVPLKLSVVTYHRRPNSNFVANDRTRELKANAPKWVITKPDGDKLVRALGDALTGIVYGDDAQVAKHDHEKLYCAPGENPCAVIEVTRLDV